jgi:putative nucleotidyltransferase with HDIG domain
MTGMALDSLPDSTFVPGPPQAAPAASNVDRPVLRRLDRSWLSSWSGELDSRRHPTPEDTDVVSRLLHGSMAPAVPGWRWLMPVGVRGPVTGATPGPRSMTAAPTLGSRQSRRTAELLAVLSACLDPAERRPSGHALRTAYLSSRLAHELNLGDDARSDLLYAGLLRDAGSTGLLPEDHPGQQTSTEGKGRRQDARRRGASAASQHLSRPTRAAALIRVLGLSQGVMEAVCSTEERWDGKGPRRERKGAIPMGARVTALASTAAIALAMAPATVERALKREKGASLDPELVDQVLTLGRNGLWAELSAPALFERLLDLEPGHRIRLSDDAGMDTITGAFADLVDSRTPMMGRHARRVAELAGRTSVALGLETRVGDDVRRAALLHDIGKLVVPIAFLEKPGELSEHERRVIGEHARAGATVLARSRVLGTLAPLIAGHHERLDGTGTFPTMLDDDRAMGARIIALCDRLEAMTADRPYRGALREEEAWRLLRGEATEPMAKVVLRIMERTLTG